MKLTPNEITAIVTQLEEELAHSREHKRIEFGIIADNGTKVVILNIVEDLAPPPSEGET